MSFFDTVTAIPPPSSLNGFSRLAVANADVLFSGKRLASDLVPLFFDEVGIGAGTAYVYDKPNAKSTISVSNLTAGKRIVQSKQRFNYQAGKAQNLAATYNFRSHDAGVTKRVYYGDGENGVFLQSSGAGYAFGIIKNGVEPFAPIPEANWEFSYGQGNPIAWADQDFGLDVSKTGIFICDLEWLGVGSVRFGFQYNNAVIWAHSLHNANNTTDVYIQNANLPVRYEIENDGTGVASEMDVICQSISSDGGVTEVGTTISVDRDVSGYTTGNNTNIHPILSFRIRSGFETSIIAPVSISIENNNNTRFRYGLLLNPTVSGVDAPSWITPETNLAIEYAINRTNSNTLSGGTLLFSAYADGKGDTPSIDTKTIIRPGFALDPVTGLTGTADEIFLFAQNLTGSSTYYGSVGIKEAT